MSTRASISIVEYPEIGIYKHSDGYPENVIPVLTMLAQKELIRWDDYSYLIAEIFKTFILLDLYEDMDVGVNYDLDFDIARFIELGYGLEKPGTTEVQYSYWIRPEERTVTIFPGDKTINLMEDNEFVSLSKIEDLYANLKSFERR